MLILEITTGRGGEKSEREYECDDKYCYLKNRTAQSNSIKVKNLKRF